MHNDNDSLHVRYIIGRPTEIQLHFILYIARVGSLTRTAATYIYVTLPLILDRFGVSHYMRSEYKVRPF